MKQLSPRWLALVTITAITLYVAWLIFAPFINVLLCALVLAVIATPIHRWISRWTPSANLSAMLTVLVVIILIIMPVLFIGFAAMSHVDDAVKTVQQAIVGLTNPESRHVLWLSRYPDLKSILDKENIAEQASKAAGWVASYSADVLAWTALALLQLLLIVFTTFYMLRDGGKLLNAARNRLPLDRRQSDTIFTNIQTIISASLRGTLFIAAVQGMLGGIAFWFLGLPMPALWGIVMFFASMIPVIGSSIIWIPAAAYLAINGSYARATVLVVWGIGVIAMVDNILRPVLVGSKTRMHELTVFFSVLGGMRLFGPIGIVVGPMVIAVALGMLKAFEEGVNDATTEKAPLRPAAAPVIPATVSGSGADLKPPATASSPATTVVNAPAKEPSSLDPAAGQPAVRRS